MSTELPPSAPDNARGAPASPYDAPSSKRALEELLKEDVRKLVFKAALWFTGGSEADAEDLVRDAVDSVCDPIEGRPWDPARGSITAHMRIVMRDLLKFERRRARTRREVVASTLAFDADAPDANPGPDDALADARELDRLRRLGGLLRDRLARSPRALRVFDLGCEGVEDASELARLIGCTVGQVYDANRQIAYHAARILAEEEKAEALRMKDLLARATKRQEFR